MAVTLLKDLTDSVQRTSVIFADYTPEQLVGVMLDSLSTLILKGMYFTLNAGITWDTIGIASPDITSLLSVVRPILFLQAKILGLKANPLKSLKTTGLDQVFNIDQAKDDEDTLDEMIISYTMDIDPRAFVMTEYDVIGSPAIQIRTLKSVLFPSQIPLI